MRTIKHIGLSIFLASMLFVGNVNADTGTEALSNKITNLLSAINDGTYGQVEQSIVDLGLAALKKTGVSVSDSQFKSDLQKYLKKSSLSKGNFKASLKDMGVKAIKGFLINVTINIASDLAGKQTGSLAVRETVWLTLKHAEMYASSNGNLVKIAVGEAFILKEVIEKDLAATDEALKSGYSADRSKAISEISSLITDGARKYMKDGDSLIDTRNAIEQAINNSGLPDITKQELKNTYLSNTGTTGANSLSGLFLRAKGNRGIHLQRLIESGNVPEFEAYLEAYYPESEYDEQRNKFDVYALTPDYDEPAPTIPEEPAPTIPEPIVLEPNIPDTTEPQLIWVGKGSVVGSSASDYYFGTISSINSFIPLEKEGASKQITYSGVSQNITVSPIGYGDYSYIAWGAWDGGTNTTYTRDSDSAVFDTVDGHWIYGQLLGPDDIPKSGSATYVGSVMGGYVNHGTGTVEPNSITGNINMAVTFRDSNNSLSGTMDLKRSGADWAVASFNNNNGRSDPSDPSFGATLNVTNGGIGELRAGFFGPNASEVGGNFYVDKQSGDGGGAAGVFRAKKQ